MLLCFLWCIVVGSKSALNLTTCASQTGDAAVADFQSTCSLHYPCPGSTTSTRCQSEMPNYLFKVVVKGDERKVKVIRKHPSAFAEVCLILMRQHLSAMKFLQFKLTSAAIKLNVFNFRNICTW